jgi:UDP-N-acetylmuramoylalanine--D-glutamate ligase
MRAHSAAVLNLAADHLDWHGSMEAYAAAKAKIYRGVSGACVYNAADPATRVMVEGADVEEGASAVGFTLGAPQVGELGLVDGVLVDRAFTPDRHSHARELATVEDLAQLAGPSGRLSPHVVANALAASALALSVGIEPDAIAQALRGFHVGAHRLQEVARAREVRFVDDSKATNAHAAGAALASFEAGQVVWIAGGLAKGAQFDSLIQQHADRLKAAVLIGKDHRDLAAALERHASAVPRVEVAAQDAGSVMDTAVRAAAGLADPGDVVLLAPASASMDQFDNYAARGDAFAAAARTLGE